MDSNRNGSAPNKVCFGAAMLVGLSFLLWVGLSTGDLEPNRYGPPPEAV